MDINLTDYLPGPVFLFWLGTVLLILLFLPMVLWERRDPGPQWAWILAILFLPYFGVFLYLLFSGNRIIRKTHLRLTTANALRGAFANPDQEFHGEYIQANFQNVSRVAYNLTRADLTGDNEVKIFCDAKNAYESMLQAMQDAQEYILLQKYIFLADAVGKEFIKVLCQKAKEGIAVRILVDQIGSFWLSERHFYPALEAGARFEKFNTLHPSRAIFLPNFRNHRKMLIIDGKVGFTGGMNIGKPYVDWLDRHIKIQGPAVHTLQDIFAEDWFFICSEKINFLKQNKAKTNGGEILQVVDSWPDYLKIPLERVFLAAIHSAQQSIFLTTPYFVPDRVMRSALTAAADRGVEIKIIIPKNTDHFFLNWASRSHLEELVEVGIQFYLYTPRMYHAKTLVVDSYFSSIGSVNMDIRSFEYNFETSVFIYGSEVAKEIEAELAEDLKHCLRVTEKYLHNRPMSHQLMDHVARLFSPIL